MLKFLFFNKRRLVRQQLAVARQHLEQGQYKETFLLCQQSRQMAGNFMAKEFLYTGACALFGLGHVHQAEQWMQEHKSGAKQDSSYLYLTAYLALHRGQPEQALLDWTSILQLDPSQSFADQLIERIKRSERQVLEEISIPDRFSRYIPLYFTKDHSSSNKARHILQRQRNAKRQGQGLGLGLEIEERFRSSKLRMPALLALLGLLLGGVLFFILDKNEEWKPARLLAFLGFKEKNLDLNLPKAPSRGTLIFPEQYQGDPPPFIYKERSTLLADYEEARRKVLAGRVNQARLILGRMELSNASFEIKERILLLRASIPFLERDDFHDPLTIQQVQAKPYLYRGAQIFWQARLQAVIPKAKEIVLHLEKAIIGKAAAKEKLEDPSSSTKLKSDSKEKTQESESLAEHESKVLIVSYKVSPSQKKELLSQLNTQNEVQVFGIFQGMEAGQLKIKAHELILLKGLSP